MPNRLLKLLFTASEDKRKTVSQYLKIAIFFTVLYTIFYWILGFYTAAIFNTVYTLLYIVVSYAFNRFKWSSNFSFKLIICILAFQLIGITTFVYPYANAILAWLVAVPLSALLVWDKYAALKWYLYVLVVIVLVPFLSDFLGDIMLSIDNPVYWLDQRLNDFLNAGVILFILIGLIHFSDQKDIYADELIKKNQILEQNKLELEEHQKMKDMFFANLSHEIRTPLNAISIISELINKHQIDEEELRKLIKTMEQSSQHLNSLVNDMLDFSKIREQKLQIQKKPFNLKETYEKTFQMLQVRYNYKNLESYIEFSADFPKMVIGDKQRLIQVLINIAGNAFKFTNEGQIQVNCSVEKQLSEKEIQLKIVVSDTGIGMDEETMNHIYDPYFQAHESTVDNTGTGLGLNIVKSLIEMHGGSIHCDSTLHKGTSFTIFLNLEIDDNQKQTAVNQRNIAHLEQWKNNLEKPLKVLLVDDNSLNLLLLDKLLSRFFGDSMIRDKAINGLDCIEKMQQETYDLILMDLLMPEMDGIEATQVIRSWDSEKGKVKIIALTANSSDNYVKKCYDAGMDDFLSKPFKTEELIEKILKNT